MTHPYHPHCGCATCCKVERADELDQQILASNLNELMRRPGFIAEQALNDEDSARVANAVATSDDAEIGRIFRSMLAREAAWHVADRSSRNNCTLVEASEALLALYPRGVQ